MPNSKLSIEIVREPERKQITGVGRVQWWRNEAAGTAPRRIRLGPNSIGWLRGELLSWVEAKVAERDAKQIPPTLKRKKSATQATESAGT